MYLNFYGFKDEPFRLTPDPRYLHLSEPHKFALTAVLEGIFYRKGLVMLTGPIGTGKTTLVHSALQIISDRKMPIKSSLLFNPVLTRDEFLEMMLDEFEVRCPSTSKPRRLAALHQMLVETQRVRGTAVLFVDEAHLLSPELLEEIRLLGNADTHEGKLLQIVLSGQPELLTIMQRKELSALQQRVAARANLRPLTVAETTTYIAERLQSAGYSGVPPFPSGTIETVHDYTSGVPRLINLLCDACLGMGFRSQQHIIQVEIAEEVAASLGMKRQPMEPVRSARQPVWQTRSARFELEEEKEMIASNVSAGKGNNSYSRPRQQEQSESVLTIGHAEQPDALKDRPIYQKTAVDRLIEAMKNRAVTRGTH